LRASIIYITPVGHNALAPSPPPTPCVNFDLCHKLAAVCGGASKGWYGGWVVDGNKNKRP